MVVKKMYSFPYCLRRFPSDIITERKRRYDRRRLKNVRKLSYIFVFIGILLLAYGLFHLFDSQINENKRLKEAQSFVSEKVVHEVDETISEHYDFVKGETIGILYIPKLDRELPIVEGTDDENLKYGVGHYIDTGYPGENRQILLSGHRDTVFRNFGELEHGDEFHIKMANGVFIYEFRDNEIVDADDTTVIDLQRQDEVLTISTCYPFNYIGSAPERYVIYAYPKLKD